MNLDGFWWMSTITTKKGTKETFVYPKRTLTTTGAWILFMLALQMCFQTKHEVDLRTGKSLCFQPKHESDLRSGKPCVSRRNLNPIYAHVNLQDDPPRSVLRHNLSHVIKSLTRHNSLSYVILICHVMHFTTQAHAKHILRLTETQFYFQ
jgi:hypothetical protein